MNMFSFSGDVVIDTAVEAFVRLSTKLEGARGSGTVIGGVNGSVGSTGSCCSEQRPHYWVNGSFCLMVGSPQIAPTTK